MSSPRPLESVPASASIRTAIEVIERSDAKLAVVVDDAMRVLGTVTDGDVRRGLIAEAALDQPALSVANKTPDLGRVGEPIEQWVSRMTVRRRRQLPIVDAEGRLVEVVSLASLTRRTARDNLVFILAGGLGTRLRPITQTVPKPLVPINGKPMLEHIVERCAAQGFRRFRLSIGYLGEMIEAHFGDGSAFGVEIDYVREASPRGTAGSLALLDAPETQPMIVMNGDILTDVSFTQLLDFHEERAAAATIGARPHHVEIPFGVLDVDGDALTAIREKPVHVSLISTGIYAVEWEIVERIRAMGEGRVDMPDVMRAAVADGRPVKAYWVHEDWVDIGRHEDLSRARKSLGQRDDQSGAAEADGGS